MHDKYVIVDDGAYILGGRNTFDYFLGDYDTKNKSLDREVLVYNTGQGGADSMKARFFRWRNTLKAYGICRNAGFSMMMKTCGTKNA